MPVKKSNLEPHARCYAEGGGNGREHRNGDLQNLLPNRFCFHKFSRFSCIS